MNLFKGISQRIESSILGPVVVLCQIPIIHLIYKYSTSHIKIIIKKKKRWVVFLLSNKIIVIKVANTNID